MKIMSWNIYKNNRRLDTAVGFLGAAGCDVICLQEVPEAALPRFLALMPYAAIADERMSFKGSGRVDHLKLVILSRFPIIKQGAGLHAPLTEPSHRYDDFTLEYAWADIQVAEEVVRVYNTHFMCVTGPTRRLSQLTEVLQHSEVPTRTIICGDFNTLGTMFFSLALFRVFRFSVREVLIREKKEIERAISAYGLVNIFRFSRTFFWVPLQLDYILIPQTYTVLERQRHPDRCGSDHYPISVTIAPFA
jgi:endonuclease/exonuclease/phosphatase family metal-dependent hydrolase